MEKSSQLWGISPLFFFTFCFKCQLAIVAVSRRCLDQCAQIAMRKDLLRAEGSRRPSIF